MVKVAVSNAASSGNVALILVLERNVVFVSNTNDASKRDSTIQSIFCNSLEVLCVISEETSSVRRSTIIGEKCFSALGYASLGQFNEYARFDG